MKQLQVVLYGNELCSEQAAGRKGVKVCGLCRIFLDTVKPYAKKRKEELIVHERAIY